MTALLLKTNKTDFEVLIQHLLFESFLFVLSSNAVLLKFTPY